MAITKRYITGGDINRMMAVELLLRFAHHVVATVRLLGFGWLLAAIALIFTSDLLYLPGITYANFMAIFIIAPCVLVRSRIGPYFYAPHLPYTCSHVFFGVEEFSMGTIWSSSCVV